MLASIVKVTNAEAAPSLDISTPTDLCEVICCGRALIIKFPEVVSIVLVRFLRIFRVLIIIIILCI
mgnify:CR=1 FL=1